MKIKQEMCDILSVEFFKDSKKVDYMLLQKLGTGARATCYKAGIASEWNVFDEESSDEEIDESTGSETSGSEVDNSEYITLRMFKTRTSQACPENIKVDYSGGDQSATGHSCCKYLQESLDAPNIPEVNYPIGIVQLMININGQNMPLYGLAHKYYKYSLSDVIDKGVSKKRAVNLLMGVVNCLDAISGIGYVHTDIKPSNILVGPDDKVIISDIDSFATIGTIVKHRGTCPYTAPEILLGLPLGVESDVFAIAEIAFEMLFPDSEEYLMDPDIMSTRITEKISSQLGAAVEILDAYTYDEDMPAASFIKWLITTRPGPQDALLALGDLKNEYYKLGLMDDSDSESESEDDIETSTLVTSSW